MNKSAKPLKLQHNVSTEFSASKQYMGNKDRHLNISVAYFILAAFISGMLITQGQDYYYSIWTGGGDGTSWSDEINWYNRSTSSGGQVYTIDTNALEVVLDADITANTLWFNTADQEITGTIQLSGDKTLKVLNIISFGANSLGGGFFCKLPGNKAQYFRSHQNVKIVAYGITLIGGSEDQPLQTFGVGANEYQNYQTECEYTQTNGQFRIWTQVLNVGGKGNIKGIGTLDLSAIDNGVLKAIDMVNIGSFRGNCRGTVSLGNNWEVEFGSKEFPMPEINIGYTSYGDSVADGSFAMNGGAFGLFTTNLVMAAGSGARSTHSAKMVFDATTNLTVSVSDTFTLSYHGRGNNELLDMSGLFDACNCSNITFNTGKLLLGNTVGTGRNITGNGHLRLGRGKGTVGNLIMGTHAASSNVRGVIELNGMELNITNFLNCGESGIISNMVGGVSSGLALVDACANSETNILLSPMTVNFTSDPEPFDSREKVSAFNPELANDWYWGLKWEGNRIEEIKQLMEGESPLLTVDTTGLTEDFAGRFGVYYSIDDDVTYLGIPLWRRPTDKGSIIKIR